MLLVEWCYDVGPVARLLMHARDLFNMFITLLQE